MEYKSKLPTKIKKQLFKQYRYLIDGKVKKAKLSIKVPVEMVYFWGMDDKCSIEYDSYQTTDCAEDAVYKFYKKHSTRIIKEENKYIY